MKKKLLVKGHKKLRKSQRKLKKAFANLGQAGKKAETPAWVTALAAIAGAVTTALADREKRGRLADIAVEAKDKAVGLLTDKSPAKEAEHEKREELPEIEEMHLDKEPEATEAHDHV